MYGSIPTQPNDAPRTEFLDMTHTTAPITIDPIATVSSCYKEKFGIPRQPHLAPAASGVITLLAPYNQPAAVAGLEQCSHIWVQFIFHASMQHPWRPSVRPPRLGGNERMGVFATRSPVRPNHLGLSVVKLDRVVIESGVHLHVSGLDLLEGTPVVDIKPYLPYADHRPEAHNLFAPKPPSHIAVHFCATAKQQLHQSTEHQHEHLANLIIQVLQQDPRPSYQQPDPQRQYGMRLCDVDVRWHYREAKYESTTWEIWVDEVVSSEI